MSDYYAVRVGRVPGVYRSWNDCGGQVSGFSGAVYKKFKTEEEARDFADLSKSFGPSRQETIKAAAIARVVEQSKIVLTSLNGARSTYPTLGEALREDDDSQRATEIAERRKDDANARDVAKLQKQFTAPPKKRPAYTRPGEEDEEINEPPAKRPATASAVLPKFQQHATGGPKVAPLTGASAGSQNVDRVWTDGGCYHNGQPDAAGGIGVFWAPNDPRNVSEPLAGQLHSNQRSELAASLRAITDTAHYKATKKALLIITDSMYTINCATTWLRGWKKNNWMSSKGGPVLNQDLIRAIDAAMQGRKVFFKHIAAHKGLYGNTEADIAAGKGVEMARAARRRV